MHTNMRAGFFKIIILCLLFFCLLLSFTYLLLSIHIEVLNMRCRQMTKPSKNQQSNWRASWTWENSLLPSLHLCVNSCQWLIYRLLLGAHRFCEILSRGFGYFRYLENWKSLHKAFSIQHYLRFGSKWIRKASMIQYWNVIMF